LDQEDQVLDLDLDLVEIQNNLDLDSTMVDLD